MANRPKSKKKDRHLFSKKRIKWFSVGNFRFRTDMFESFYVSRLQGLNEEIPSSHVIGHHLNGNRIIIAKFPSKKQAHDFLDDLLRM